MSDEERLTSMIFRVTLILGPLLAGAAAAYNWVASPGFSQEWQDALTWSGEGGIFPMNEEELTAATLMAAAQVGGFALIALANQVALFFYWGPSRIIYLILCLLGFGVTPFLGLVVQTPLEALLYDLSLFTSGMTLALAYFSAVAKRFRGLRNEELP